METFTYTHDGQDIATIDNVLAEIKPYLGDGEEILYVAVQKKSILNFNPDCILISKRRIYLGEFKGLRKKFQVEVFDWEEINEIKMTNEPFGSMLIVIPIYDIEYVISSIPAKQAEKLFSIAENYWKITDFTEPPKSNPAITSPTWRPTFIRPDLTTQKRVTKEEFKQRRDVYLTKLKQIKFSNREK